MPGTAPASRAARPLSEVARYVITPAGIASTAWPKVRDTCQRLGWGFDRWQYDSGRLILAKRADGSYAADTIVISIPRQVGKTYLIACIIFALCLLEPGLTVVWTAHRKTTAKETFAQFDAMAMRPKVRPHIRQVLRGKGDEAIHFTNRSRILFGSRESGFGRGFAGVDILVCDEAQIMTDAVMEDMAATQNTAPNPLFFLMGTPPRPRDPGETFTLFRQEALDGDSDTTLYIETSADRGTDPMDRDQLRKANPSYPHRTTERALLRLRKKLKSDDAWDREARGIWDEAPIHQPVVGSAKWANMADAGPADDVRPAGLGVHSSASRHLSVAAAWVVDDVIHVEEVWAGPDADECAAWIRKHAGRRIPVAIDNGTPSPVAPLLKAGLTRVLGATAADQARACGVLADKIRHNRFTHGYQPQLHVDVHRRPVGSAGGWMWDLRNDDGTSHPLVAATLAIHAASTTKRNHQPGTGRRSRTTTRSRRAAVL